MKTKQSTAIASIFLLFFTISVHAGQSCPPLGTKADPVLQKGLEKSIQKLNLQQAVDQKKLCVSLVDITNPDAPRMAAVNGNQMMYAASLPKIAILLGAFERIERGDMKLDAETRDTLTRMIRNSSNTAATEMLNRVGKTYLANLLQSPKYRLYDPARNGGLWVGKEYGKSPAWKRDPLYNLSHGATALQVARFYYMLENGLLVSPRGCVQMKEILSKPAIHHKFVKGLLTERPGTRIFRKSGTWRQYHCDSGIIERDGRRYIAVALASDSQGSQWLSDLIVELDDLIFRTPPKQASLLSETKS